MFYICSMAIIQPHSTGTLGTGTHNAGPWPKPPACVPADKLRIPPQGARITVAGLVILRQRPGTAKGVIFITLEDETGVVNIVVWRAMYEQFRRAVIAGRMLRVTGRVQRAHGVIHILADQIEDISGLLDQLVDATAPMQRL